MSDEPTTVAVACQGGGSHTAFTAGVLRRLLDDLDDRYELVAFTGTSGGALCALLAWYGLRTGDASTARAALADFWNRIETRGPLDALVNLGVVSTGRLLDSGFPIPRIAPAYNPGARLAERRLRRAVEAQVDPAVLDDLVAASDAESPKLLVSAVDATDGTFEIFTDRPVTETPADASVDPVAARIEERPKPLSIDAVLASASVPTLFEGIRLADDLGGPVHEYWDGLFSQNPPIRNLLDGPERVERKPDEIWLIRINPAAQRGDLSTLGEIVDRRNELAGSLSLAQELYFVHQVNGWIADGFLPRDRYKPVVVRELELDETRLPGERDLRAATKLDRRSAFIADLMALGEQQAAEFLARPDDHRLLGPA